MASTHDSVLINKTVNALANNLHRRLTAAITNGTGLNSIAMTTTLDSQYQASENSMMESPILNTSFFNNLTRAAVDGTWTFSNGTMQFAHSGDDNGNPLHTESIPSFVKGATHTPAKMAAIICVIVFSLMAILIVGIFIGLKSRSVLHSDVEWIARDRHERRAVWRQQKLVEEEKRLCGDDDEEED